MKTFKITEKTLMEIFNYLNTRPYGEVERFIVGLRETAASEVLPQPEIIGAAPKSPKKK